MTGQIRYVDVGKNQKPTVVHDPLEIVRSSGIVPANPSIPSFDPPSWAGKLKTPNNPRFRSADFDEIAQVRSKWDLVPKVMMSVNTCSNKTAKASTPWFYKAQDVFSALRDESFAKPEAGPWSGSTRGYLTQIESEMNEADEKLLLLIISHQGIRYGARLRTTHF